MKPSKYFQKLKLMPVLIIQLFVVQFFTWFALFALWIYSTPAITKYVFRTTDASSADFEKGIMWIGYCFAFYSLFAACLAFNIPVLIKKIGILKTHALALLIAAVGFLAMYYVHNKWSLFVPFACIGIGWSSISNIPYKIVSTVVPAYDMDFFMSVFSFSVVIPQVLAASLLQFITKHFLNGNTLYTILVGGVSMLISGILMYVIANKTGSVIPVETTNNL
jgi:maltose/moltooligosaccharide transporter